MVKGHHHLEQARRPCRRLGVTYLTFHRAQCAIALALALTEGQPQTLQLGRVPGHRARAVGFDQTHGLGRVAGLLVGPAQRLGLALS